MAPYGSCGRLDWREWNPVSRDGDRRRRDINYYVINHNLPWREHIYCIYRTAFNWIEFTSYVHIQWSLLPIGASSSMFSMNDSSEITKSRRCGTACPLALVGEFMCCCKKIFRNVSTNKFSKAFDVLPVFQLMYGRLKSPNISLYPCLLLTSLIRVHNLSLLSAELLGDL